MSQIKKRQHFVWRKYLRAWTNDESIWTYFIELSKIERVNLMGVAQEKYFYKLIDLEESEEKLLKQLVEHISKHLVKQLNLDFLALFTSANKLKKHFEKSALEGVDKEKIAEDIRVLEHNLMEDTHCVMEGFGNDLLNCKNVSDLKALDDEQSLDLDKAIMFVCFQYLRTKAMKKAVLKGFKGEKLEGFVEKTWNIVSYCMATNIAQAITLRPDTRFVFLTNNTGNYFITGDQPAINLLGDELTEDGDEIKGLEMYYPLSPVTALIIHHDTAQAEKFSSKILNSSEVDFYNQEILKNADFNIFANSKTQLEKLSQL